MGISVARKELEVLLQGVKGIITHNDMDGIASANYLHNKTGIPIVGIVDLYDGILTSMPLTGENIYDYLFLDCGMVLKNVKSLDHHFIPPIFYDENKVVYDKYFNPDWDIRWKNANSCLYWLMGLFGDDAKNYNNEQLMMMALPDGSHSMYNRFQANSIRNLRNLELMSFHNSLKYMAENFDNSRTKKISEIDVYLGTSIERPYFRAQYNWKNGPDGTHITSTSMSFCLMMNWKDGFTNNYKYYTRLNSYRGKDINNLQYNTFSCVYLGSNKTEPYSYCSIDIWNNISINYPIVKDTPTPKASKPKEEEDEFDFGDEYKKLKINLQGGN